MIRLQQVDIQCSSCQATVPPNTHLIDENLRGYVVLLSAHFQGFCRDLYTEASSLVAAAVPVSLKFMIRTQCDAQLKLRHNNPTFDNLVEDFDRFGFDLKTTL